MAEHIPQTYANHARFHPVFHFFVVPVFFINFLVAAIQAVRSPGWISIWTVVMAAALVAAGFLIRVYALRVQDRLIRLEERLRLERLLPEALKARIGELTEGQLVGLRFASDGEVASLVEKTLANGWRNREIKKGVVNWRPDYFRV